MPRLPLTDRPRSDESLDSWLEYLAELMSCSVRNLLAMCDINPGRRSAGFTTGVDDDFARNLAAATGSSIDEIHRATVARYVESLGTDGRINPSLLSGCSTRFCPQCLADTGGRWKLIWHLQTSTVCRDHRCLLLERCPRCGGKPRMTTSRKPQALWPPRQRHAQGLCGILGCMDALVAAAAPSITVEDSAMLSQQLWIDANVTHPQISIRSLGDLTERTGIIMRDIVNIKTAAGRETVLASVEHKTSSLYSSPSAATTRLFDEISNQDLVSPYLIGEAVAQTLLASTYTATDRDAVIDNLNWLPSATAIKSCYRRPESDKSSGPAGLSTRKLLYHREMARSSNNSPPLWHAEILQTAGVEPLHARTLPSRMWPAIVHAHPSTKVSTLELLPLTSVISLAALGSHGPPANQRKNFGVLIKSHRLDLELQALWSGDSVGQMLDFYLTLHEHLRSQPPPIDYARRRQRFPAPTVLYGSRHPHPNPARFVWQILTGSDPFSTAGAGQQFGPAIATYGRFVTALTTAQKSVLVEEARRLLIMAGIFDEPIYYAPAFDGTEFRRRDSDELQHMSIDDALIPGTHIIALRSASQDRDPGIVLQRALDGDTSLARALAFFAATAGKNQAVASRHVRKSQQGLAYCEDVLEVLLGRVLHARGRRGNPRALTPTGIELRDRCMPHLDQLCAIGGVASLPRLSGTHEGD